MTKPKEGIIVHLDEKKPLADRVGTVVGINYSLQPLNEGYFFVDHPEHAPRVCQIVDGIRKKTGFVLVPNGEGGWTIHEKNVTDSLKGLAHLI